MHDNCIQNSLLHIPSQMRDHEMSQLYVTVGFVSIMTLRETNPGLR